MEQAKKSRTNTAFALILSAFALTGCGSVPKSDINTRQYYYPYLTRSEVASLDVYNVIGVFPSDVIVPKYQQDTLERQLNANNIYPNNSHFAIQKINDFLAETARNKLGCGPLPAGTVFTIPQGIYHTANADVSLATPLKLTLNKAIPTLCIPKTIPIHLETDIASPYWKFNFTQRQAFQ